MKKNKWILGLMAAILVLGTVQAELVLVKDGKSLAPIILAVDATEDTQRAAEVLADYVRKISGVQPEIITGSPDPVPDQAIWVGLQPGLDKWFPIPSLTFQYPEEILIVANAKHLLIAGRDRLVAGDQVEFGTANAVYTFLHDQLDVRWLWPGALGEDYIQRDTLAFEPFTFRYHPQFRLRKFRGITQHIWRYPKIKAELADWGRFHRLGFGSLRYTTSHTAFTYWGRRYQETHPEYLALQPDGTRNPPSTKVAKVCMSNPQVWEQWLDDVTVALEKDPAGNIFGAAPSDSHNNGVCVCESCRAWDVQDGPIWGRYSWRGLSQEYVAMSDRYATFVNHLADKLKGKFPDRDFYVYDIAYGPNTPAPLRTKMADNTIIGYVGHFPLGNATDRLRQKAEFSDWSENAPHLLYRPNYWYFGGGVWAMPEVAFTDTIEDLRFLAEHRCIGLDIDAFQGHWATQGPQYYLLAQLAWNPMQDGQAVLADYYHRGFGPAAAEISQYWKLMEATRAAICSHPDHGSNFRYRMPIAKLIRKIFNKERQSQAEQILNRAATAAETGSDVHQQRVAFVRAGFDVVCNMLASADWMDRVHATQGADTEAVKKTLDLWQEIETISERYPYSILYSVLRYRIGKKAYMGNVQKVFGPPSEEWLKALTPAPEDASSALASPIPKIVTTPKSRVSQRSKKAATDWKLVLHDQFDRKELGPDWMVLKGSCSIRDGELVSPGMTTLITANGFPGFHRIEYTAVTDVKPFSLFADQTQNAQTSVSDLSAMIQTKIGERAVMSGYFFQFGGVDNTVNRLLRDSVEVWGDYAPVFKIVPDQTHQIVFENDEGHLRFIVDGNVLYEGTEPASLVGEEHDRAGLYLWTAARIKEIKLYVKALDDGLI